MNTETNPLAAFSEALAAAVETAGAATVTVNARRRMPASGIAYAADLVLTADHVIERDEDLSVTLPDGTQITASLAGRDPGNDLALLRLVSPVSAVAVPAPQEGRVGQLVLALGRPSPDGIEASLGVISAVGGPVRNGRGGMLERYLRTDAIPYPGFSGGPLINAAGQIVGINTSGLASGTSLAIPVSIAFEIAQTLAEHGSVRRGYLGVRSQLVEIPENMRAALNRSQAAGLLVVGIESGSPAESGGVLVGDILVGINGQPVEEHDALLAHLNGAAVDRPASLEVLRGGQLAAMQVTVRPRPAETEHRHGHGRGHGRGHGWGRR